MSSIGGSAAKARATPTRCAWPWKARLGSAFGAVSEDNPTRSRSFGNAAVDALLVFN